MRKIAGATLLLPLLGCHLAEAAEPCAYDRKTLLALSEHAFDQDLSNGGGGWRAIAKLPGCELAAADLLAAYQVKHPDSSFTLAWHEGQLRALAGQYKRAIPLLQSAKKPAGHRLAGWNYYVDATVAFLRHDKQALLSARRRLAAVAYHQDAGLPPLKDGYVVFPAQPGHPFMRMRWPPNINVVDGLVSCFGKPYSEAYGPSCRSSGH